MANMPTRVAVGAAALLFGAARRLTKGTPYRRAPEPSDNTDTRYEPADTPLRVIGLLAGIVAGVIALVIASLLLIYPHSTLDQPKALKAAMPDPQPQPSPRGDMDGYRTGAERQLHSYGWIDREKGIVHVPVSEATRRIVERGIPDWPELEPGR